MGIRERLALSLLPILLIACSGTRAPPPAVLAPPEVTADEPPELDRSGKGAVLCMWSIYAVAQEIGQRCFLGQDVELQRELSRSIARTEAFVIANGSPDQIVTLRKQTRPEIRKWAASLPRKELCASDPAHFYADFKRLGPDGLRSQTDDVLSVPREPVLNPCV